MYDEVRLQYQQILISTIQMPVAKAGIGDEECQPEPPLGFQVPDGDLVEVQVHSGRHVINVANRAMV